MSSVILIYKEKILICAKMIKRIIKHIIKAVITDQNKSRDGIVYPFAA